MGNNRYVTLDTLEELRDLGTVDFVCGGKELADRGVLLVRKARG